MSYRIANGYECLECGETERDGIGRADVECGSCGSTNTIQRRFVDCEDEATCANPDAHHYGAGWDVLEAVEP